MEGAAVSLHRWRCLVPVIVGGCQDQQQGRRLSSLVNDGAAVVLDVSSRAAGIFSTARPRLGGGRVECGGAAEPFRKALLFVGQKSKIQNYQNINKLGFNQIFFWEGMF